MLHRASFPPCVPVGITSWSSGCEPSEMVAHAVADACPVMAALCRASHHTVYCAHRSIICPTVQVHRVCTMPCEHRIYGIRVPTTITGWPRQVQIMYSNMREKLRMLLVIAFTGGRTGSTAVLHRYRCIMHGFRTGGPPFARRRKFASFPLL